MITALCMNFFFFGRQCQEISIHVYTYTARDIYIVNMSCTNISPLYLGTIIYYGTGTPPQLAVMKCHIMPVMPEVNDASKF